jgi:hypothetical protein
MKLLAETLERAEHDSLPDPTHQVKVKEEVMDRVEGGGRHLARYI